jgi:hypothetical protein
LYDSYQSDRDEVNELMELVRKKLVLRKVKFLEWTNNYTHLREDWGGVEYHFNELLKNIFIYFPDIILTR